MSNAGAPPQAPRRLVAFLSALLFLALAAAVAGAWAVWGWGGAVCVGGVLTADLLTRIDFL